MRGKIQVIVGGQYGSEAKGAVAAHLAREEEDLFAIRVAGPNAGHTVIDDNGVEFKLQQIPVAAAVNPTAHVAIAAGSEIELDLMHSELKALEDAGHGLDGRFHVDRSATILDERHAEADKKLVGLIGSTGKGIGSARADRIMRNADVYGGEVSVAPMAQMWLRSGKTVQIEGTQGYGLGLHGDHYPHCTSSDCRAIDFLAMAGVNPWEASKLEVWVTLRTFPIRVAGNSGFLRNEISWADLGVPEERTTVTKKVRRVGEWDNELALEALAANGAGNGTTRVALTFMDYLVPEVAGKTGDEVRSDARVQAYIRTFEDLLNHRIHLVGTGPAAYTDWEA